MASTRSPSDRTSTDRIVGVRASHPHRVETFEVDFATVGAMTSAVEIGP
jgi:hypothetical protein